MKTKNMTTLYLKSKSIGRSPLRIGLPRVQPIWIIRGFLLIALAVTSLALSPMARAVGPPVPDGGYPGENTAEGQDALFFLTQGIDNTAIGFEALFHTTTGSFNTAIGFEALLNNTGEGNTAIGVEALLHNTTGINNTANGAEALFHTTTGSSNTATGIQALQNNSTGNSNTATGVGALQNNTVSNNTAYGASALYSNTTGINNTATGFGALYSNTGAQNTASGFKALYFNSSGTGNTGEGYRALLNNTGSNNIGLGSNAGINLTTGSSNIDIGNNGVAAETTTIRIGASQTKTFIAGIRGKTTVNANAIPVLIDSAGQLGTTSSSLRFKHEIKPMDQTSEAILGLKPVTFHYKSDSTGTPQFGLIAEEVAKVNPDLVVRDDNGEIYTVRYDAVNAMLLNEFLKEHRKMEEQEATISQLKSSSVKQEATITQLKSTVSKQETTTAEQQKRIEGLTAVVQKVSDQFELSKAAPQIVENNQ